MNLRLQKNMIVSIVFGILSIILIYNYVSRLERGVIRQYQSQVILVAKTDIPAYHEITADKVRLENIPKNLVLNGAVKDIKNTYGKLSNVDIIAGEQITSRRLVDKHKADMPMIIPSGMRAVTISPDGTGDLGKLVNIGDRVDVILANQTSLAEGSDVSILEDIEVAKIHIQNSDSGKDNLPISELVQSGSIDYITLIVTQKQAEKIMYADEYGKIRIALRPKEPSKKSNEPSIDKVNVEQTIEQKGYVTIDSLKQKPVATTHQAVSKTKPMQYTNNETHYQKKNPVQTHSNRIKTIEVIRGMESVAVTVSN